ncbi:hypothetical protein IVB34_12805 [Bradyrhizobium sp. 2]|uniref:hypothetical protein n=2 Tax=Bradyrhizobium sp. 2 TaxID=190045 RepID=UPI001FF74600|nr:hypothetical protein [Bradyrhizobium sp. 2]MCK1459235.1 hypothetical protein [Bradyrhizobium sp. 2]
MYQKAFVLLRTYAALATFLASYFALTVVGNLIYFTPFGDGIGRVQIADFSISNFQTAGSFGYWILLFLPFVVAPPIVFAVKRILAPMAPWIKTIKISTPAYLVALAICYAYASVSLWRANATGLFLRGNDAVDSVYDRFELLSSLGFWPQVTIKSLLVALSCYGLVVAIETRKPLWLLVAAANVVGAVALSRELRMKRFAPAAKVVAFVLLTMAAALLLQIAQL